MDNPDRMTKGRKLSPAVWVTLLSLLAAVSWATVVAEYRWMGHVTMLTVAPALMFTSFLVLWPFMGGLKMTAQGIREVLACYDCGALIVPTPRIKFCIRCGAYPKIKAIAQSA
jgi:hypothetical protein